MLCTRRIISFLHNLLKPLVEMLAIHFVMVVVWLGVTNEDKFCLVNEAILSASM